MYTAQQLVFDACQICNRPGFTQQAGRFLNIILADYAQTMDLDVIRLDTTLSIGPQATTPYWYSLPANYLRAYDVFYNVLGEIFNPTQMEMKDLDAAFTGGGIANYPTNWATDMSKTPPVMAFYPPPAVPLSVTVRYRPQTTDIVNPDTSSTIPWFPNQRVLLTDLCSMVGMAADDARVKDWHPEVESRMRKYLIMDDDKEGFSETVKLDPRSFRGNVNLPPSKKLGF